MVDAPFSVSTSSPYTNLISRGSRSSLPSMEETRSIETTETASSSSLSYPSSSVSSRSDGPAVDEDFKVEKEESAGGPSWKKPHHDRTHSWSSAEVYKIGGHNGATLRQGWEFLDAAPEQQVGVLKIQESPNNRASVAETVRPLGPRQGSSGVLSIKGAQDNQVVNPPLVGEDVEQLSESCASVSSSSDDGQQLNLPQRPNQAPSSAPSPPMKPHWLKSRSKPSITLPKKHYSTGSGHHQHKTSVALQFLPHSSSSSSTTATSSPSSSAVGSPLPLPLLPPRPQPVHESQPVSAEAEFTSFRSRTAGGHFRGKLAAWSSTAAGAAVDVYNSSGKPFSRSKLDLSSSTSSAPPSPEKSPVASLPPPPRHHATPSLTSSPAIENRSPPRRTITNTIISGGNTAARTIGSINTWANQRFTNGVTIDRSVHSSSMPAQLQGGKVFGKELALVAKQYKVAEKDRHGLVERETLPALIVRCTECLEQWLETEEGIFRISGRTTQIQKLRTQFDTGLDVPLLGTDIDPNDVASVYKAYLRELPSPILTLFLGQRFDEVMKDHTGASARDGNFGVGGGGNGESFSREKRQGRANGLVEDVAELMQRLPLVNWCLLKEVTRLLKVTCSFSATNKMTISNLLLVFCPSLSLSPPFLRLLIEHHDEIFSVQPPPEEDDLTPIISRRSSGPREMEKPPQIDFLPMSTSPLPTFSPPVSPSDILPNSPFDRVPSPPSANKRLPSLSPSSRPLALIDFLGEEATTPTPIPVESTPIDDNPPPADVLPPAGTVASRTSLFNSKTPIADKFKNAAPSSFMGFGRDVRRGSSTSTESAIPPSAPEQPSETRVYARKSGNAFFSSSGGHRREPAAGNDEIKGWRRRSVMLGLGNSSIVAGDVVGRSVLQAVKALEGRNQDSK